MFVFGVGDRYRLVMTLLHGGAHTESRVPAAIRARFERALACPGGECLQLAEDLVDAQAASRFWAGRTQDRQERMRGRSEGDVALPTPPGPAYVAIETQSGLCSR